MIFYICAVLMLAGCGYVDYNDEHGHTIEYEVGEVDVEVVFDKAKIEKGCFSNSCHGGSAPVIPAVGQGFKDSKKIREVVENKRMPPGGWSDAKIAGFIKFLDSK